MYAIINPDGSLVSIQQEQGIHAKGRYALPVVDAHPEVPAGWREVGPTVTVTATEYQRVWTIEPIPAREPVHDINKRAFRDLAVGIIGFPAWLAAQEDPALAELWDVYAAGMTVSRTDVGAFLPAFVARGHATQGQADQLLEDWPIA